MQIRLGEQELHTAIADYIQNRGFVLKPTETFEISLTAGRGENGFYADVDVVANTDHTSVDMPPPVEPDQNDTNIVENQQALDLDL